MPLFKFNLHAAVMPSIEVDGTVELIIPNADADVAIPLFLVDGAMCADGETMVSMLSVSGRMEGVANGEVVLPMLSVDGFTAIPVQIEGDAFFPFVIASGSMQVKASIEMPCLRVLGAVVVGNQFDCGVSFPLLAAGGVAVEPLYMAGSATLQSLFVNGSVSQSKLMEADGTVIFPHFSASAMVVGQAHHGHGADSTLRYADDRRLI